jgi:hypothetical protein
LLTCEFCLFPLEDCSVFGNFVMTWRHLLDNIQKERFHVFAWRVATTFRQTKWSIYWSFPYKTGRQLLHKRTVI